MFFDKFSPQQLRDAIEIEMTKTDDPKLASKIAMKRLQKDPTYYEKSYDIISEYGMNKARPTKYYKRVPKATGKGYNYYYTKDEYEKSKKPAEEKKEKKEKSDGWIGKIAGMFGFKDKKQVIQKVQSDYNTSEIGQKYGITWDGWKSHLAEYFMNKSKWDALFAKKLARQKEVQESANKKEALKKEFEEEKKIKKTAQKNNLNKSIMYIIYNLYGKESKNEISRNTTNESGIGSRDISTGNEAIQSGRIKADPLSDVPEREPSSEREIDVLASSIAGERPGRDVRLTQTQIKASRKAILDLLEQKTDDEMTDEDKDLLRQYEGAGGIKEDDKSVHGTLYEYYTPRNVVSKIWDLVKKYTGDGPQKVLEPSAGIGRFAEDQPDNFDFTMLELDPISSRINGILFPDADIKNETFQKMFMKGNVPMKDYQGKKFSVVIGNPPYGAYEGVEKGLGEGKDHTRYEEYFIDRGLDAMEEGGIMAYIVPSGFLRGNKFSDAKINISKKGKLLEAYRMPNGTFQTTGVGTDIIIIRKEKGNSTDFLDDNYFKKNPDKILGEQTTKTDRFGKPAQYVSLKDGETFDAALNRIDINDVPIAKIGSPSQKDEVQTKVNVAYKKKATPKKSQQKTKSKDNFETMPDVETQSSEEFNKKYNKDFSQNDLEIWQKTQYDGKIEVDKLSSSLQASLDKNPDICIDSKGDYYHVINYISGNIYDKLADLEKARDEIGDKRYEAQKKLLEDALPGKKTTKNFYISPISDFAKNFEFTDEETGESTEFIKRFFEWATGNTNSRRNMNWNGGVTQHDLPAGVSWSDIVDYIDQKPVRASSRGDKVTNKYVAAKTKELRRDVAEKLVKRFTESGLNADEQKELEFEYNKRYNSYVAPDYTKLPLFLDGISTGFKGKDLIIKEKQLQGASFLCNKGNGLLAYDVGVGKTMTGILATVNQLQTGRAKKPVVCVPKAVYSNWIKEINELFPDIKINELGNLGKTFTGGKFPEIQDGTLSVITYEALQKMTFKDDTIHGGLLDDMIESQQSTKEKMSDRDKAAERERIMTFLGKAVKASSQVLENGISVQETNLLDKTGLKKYGGRDIAPDDIKASYDVAGHPAILVKEGSKWSMIDVQSGLSLSHNEGSRKSAMETALDRLDGKTVEEYNEMISSKPALNTDIENNFETMPEEEIKSGSFYFEDLGFDHITVDEVHNFKNVFTAARPQGKEGARQANEFDGIGTGGRSADQAMKMFALTQLIQKNNNDRNVFALSATPFTNSPLEIYNILSLIARKKLKELGIYNLHEFMAQFAKIKNEWSIDSKGEITRKAVMKEFQNLSALQNLIREYIDKVDGEEAGIQRPVKNTHIAEMNMTPLQKAIYEVEIKRFDLKDSNGRPLPGATLKAINNMRMASLSPSLIKFDGDDLYKDSDIPAMVGEDDFIEDSPKLKFTTDSISKLYESRPDVGQVMYMPRGVKKYDLVIANLAKKGVPKDAIATMSSSTSPDKKDAIMKSFNDPNGKIKVVIGSETIKEGVNLNGNTATIYNTLLGWNPTETIQVEGRAWRQGNEQGNVHVVYPQLLDSVDASMYQKHDEKSQRLAAIWSYKGDSLNVEDINPEEIKFDLIKDPEKRAKFAMDLELESLDDQKREKRIYIDTLAKFESDFNEATRNIENSDSTIKSYEEDVATAEAALKEVEDNFKEFKKKTSKKEPGYQNMFATHEREIRWAKDKVSTEKKYVRDKVREKKLAQQVVDGISEKLNDMGIDFSGIDNKIAEETAIVEKLHVKEVEIKENKQVYIDQAKAEIAEKQSKTAASLESTIDSTVAVIAGNLKPMQDVLESGELGKNKFFKNSELLSKAVLFKRFNPESHQFEYRRVK